MSGSLVALQTRSDRWMDLVSMGVLRTWRERTYARETSRRALQVYRQVAERQPELVGVQRYREVVARQTGLDDSGVRRVLNGAEHSFAAWPKERPLRFRDVVQYLVISKCLSEQPTEVLGRSRLTAIVEAEIPEHY
jgi:hypothetical protein